MEKDKKLCCVKKIKHAIYEYLHNYNRVVKIKQRIEKIRVLFYFLCHPIQAHEVRQTRRLSKIAKEMSFDVSYHIMHDLLSVYTLDDLKKWVSEVDKDGWCNYSLLSELILKRQTLVKNVNNPRLHNRCAYLEGETCEYF